MFHRMNRCDRKFEGPVEFRLVRSIVVKRGARARQKHANVRLL